MTSSGSFQDDIGKFQQLSLIVGAAALVVSALGAWMGAGAFYQSYLLSYLFWMGITLGCLGFVMLHYLTRGQWGFVTRRLLEAGTNTLVLLAVLFLPLLLGMTDLYIWARPEAVANDVALQHKSAYLNISGFVIRTIVYFLLWLGTAFLLNRWAKREKATGDTPAGLPIRYICGPGLVVYVLTITFASIDWSMSLEPHWFSTIYGPLFLVGQGVSAMAFSILVLGLLRHHEPLAKKLTKRHFRDLGNLLLAFVMLWAYISFSQYLIIWSGNLPEEISWYVARTHGGWQWVAIALIVFHFFTPFTLLLFRKLKEGITPLLMICGGLLVMRWIDLYWLTMPTFRGGAIEIHWLDFSTLLAIGGLWLGVFARNLRKGELFPVSDAYLRESPSNE